MIPSQGCTPLPPGPIFFFLVIKYFIFIVGPPFQNLRPPFSSISLATLNQIATIQSKSLTKMLGSKELGTNVLELQCVMFANPDQNLESRFRLLKVRLL